MKRALARRRPRRARSGPAVRLFNQIESHRLGYLCDISRLLTSFENIEQTVPPILGYISRTIPLRSALVVEATEGKTRLHAWHGPKESADRIATVRRQALASYSYMTGSPASDVQEFRSSLPDGAEPVEGKEVGLVSLPLASSERAVFGTLHVEGVRPLTEGDLAFVNVVANHLAIALERRQAYLNERLLRQRAESAEREVRRFNAELESRVSERTAKMEEALSDLKTFVFTVAHDLRTPLRAIHRHSQALLDKSLQTDAARKEHAGHIAQASARMYALLEDLLTYSRLTLSGSDAALGPVPLGACLEQARAALEDQLRRANGRLEAQGELPAVIGHEASVVLALGNLLSNALKFVGKDVQPRIRIWAERRGKWARLWVQDNGIGIPAEQHERVFRVFERLHGEREYPGTGMGLAIVRKAVERMGGRVGVESEAGQGSRFWLELRLAEEGR